MRNVKQVITVDYETFWSQDFSLTKMSFVDYIRSPEFEVISCSVKVGDGPVQCVFGHDEVGDFLRTLPWQDSAMICHNGNEFDFPLTVWTYGIRPAMFIDTLCMARPKHQSDVGGSLKKLSQQYNLPDKDNTALLNTKGRRLSQFSQEERAAMAAYNVQDVENTYALYKLLLPDTPAMELLAMDMTARMIVEPKFDLDDELLQDTLAKVQQKKLRTLIELQEKLGVDSPAAVESLLASNQKFAEILRDRGIEPPMKISKTTKQPTLALAKTDPGFVALTESDDEEVQMLCAARLGTKSTQLETRIENFLRTARLCFEGFPVPLAYHSATTGRWGGRMGLNLQNLPRINPKRPALSDALRMALQAPLGHKVVVSDLSGIELRVNHWLWDVPSTKAAYAADPTADLYTLFAGEFLYSKPQDQIEKHERQMGKVAQLQLGFQSWAETFKAAAKAQGGITIELDESEKVCRAWRDAYPEIVQGWRSCQRGLEAMIEGSEYKIDPRGLCRTGDAHVVLPSGRKLYYPGIRQEWDEEDQKWNTVYGEGRNTSYIYGGKFTNNLVQAIARDVILYHALRVYALTGMLPALMVHDELVYVVPDAKAEQHLDTVQRVMRKPPKWLPGIVLWSEGDIAPRYGEAK